MLPFFERQLVGVQDILEKNILHLPGQYFVIKLHIHLEIADETQAVQVRRPDGRPDAIDGRGLRMHHCTLVEEQANAACQALRVVAARQPISEGMIGHCR